MPKKMLKRPGLSGLLGRGLDTRGMLAFAVILVGSVACAVAVTQPAIRSDQNSPRNRGHLAHLPGQSRYSFDERTLTLELADDAQCLSPYDKGGAWPTIVVLDKLPETARLTAGFSVAPGIWVVPLDSVGRATISLDVRDFSALPYSGFVIGDLRHSRVGVRWLDSSGRATVASSSSTCRDLAGPMLLSGPTQIRRDQSKLAPLSEPIVHPIPAPPAHIAYSQDPQQGHPDSPTSKEKRNEGSKALSKPRNMRPVLGGAPIGASPDFTFDLKPYWLEVGRPPSTELGLLDLLLSSVKCFKSGSSGGGCTSQSNSPSSLK